MKYLYLIRHGKSSWSDPSLRDFDRPLNKRGQANVPFMAKRMKKRGAVPDVILASPAVRAATTARIFADILDLPSSALVFHDDIYSASAYDLLRLLRRVPDRVNALALVGHNNAISLFAEAVLGEKIGEMPTSGLVAIAFPQEGFVWKKLRAGSGKMVFFEYPKFFVSKG